MNLVYSSGVYGRSIYRAIIAILIGVVLVCVPDNVIKITIIAIGVVFLITGILSLYSIVRNKKNGTSRFSFSGLGSLLLGLLLVVNPTLFSTSLVILFGLLLIVGAIGQFFNLYMSRQFGRPPFYGYIFSLITLIAGFVLIFYPFETQRTIVVIFGVMAIYYGVTDLLTNYLIRRLRLKHDSLNAKELHDTKDVEYENVE